MLPRSARLHRRTLITSVLSDVADGVQALGELDFARLCRGGNLPIPSRQVLRTGHFGRAYLDVYFDDFQVVVEIDGAHHAEPINAIDDALRQNSLGRPGQLLIRIPVIGLRAEADAFMAQVAAALRQNGWTG